MIHYLGPSVGKVPLSTWDEVVTAAAGGLLEETQWVELKAMLGPANKAVNVELARDLASLSLYGGVLVFGVKDKTFEVVGCDVAGMVERISQVASTRVHPPLSPVIYPAIQHPEDEGSHVLVVEVPASAQAPHMVDGAYWGRSSDGKRKLADPEVRERMEARAGDAATFKARLLSMVDRDPLAPFIADHPTGNGHIYLLAEPCAPVFGRGEELHLQNVVVQLFRDQDARGSLSSLDSSARDPLGLAVATRYSEPMERRYEDLLCHLLCLDEDSSLEFVSGGGTMYRPRGFREEGAIEVVGTTTILKSTLQFFQLIGELSLRHWGYAGQWRVGIHVTNLAGKEVSFNDFMRRGTTFPRDVYTNQMLTAPASWTEGAEPEARKLLAGFLRGIGREGAALHEVQL